MQLCVGLGAQLAVLHHVGDLAAHRLGQFAVAGGGQTVFVDRRQRLAHIVVDGAHCLAQRRVGGPALAGIELQRRRAFAVAVVMAGGGEAGAGVAEGAGEDDGEGESVGFADHR